MEVAVIPEDLDIKIEDFAVWLKAETRGAMGPLNADAGKLVDKIVQRVRDFRDVCEKLAQEAEREEERGRAVRKARVTGKLTRYFLKQVDKVVFPEEMSSRELNRLQNELEKTVRSIEREKNVWSRKRIDFAYARLTGIASEMKSFLSESYSNAEMIEGAFLESDRIVELRAKLSRNRRDGRATETKLQSIQKKISAREHELTVVENSAELGDLVEVGQIIQQLRKQAKHELRHLKKPFKKLANLARSSKCTLSSEEVEKLGQLVEDPYVALATEKQGQPTLRSLLTKMGRALEEGAIELKSSRLRKAQESVSAILNENVLESLQSSCANAFLRSRDLHSSTRTLVAEEKIEKIKTKLEQLRKQNEIAASRLESLKVEHKKLLGKIVEQKEAVEKAISTILEKDIRIRV
jgi:predicted  nucleic acid-binding Zn-ribbon protein